MADLSEPESTVPAWVEGDRPPPALATLSDREVVAQLRQGDRQALGELYDRYGALVYRVALRMLGNPEEAADLAQDIFLVFDQRQTYDPNRGSVSSFLMTLTRSRSIDRLRSRQAKWRSVQRLHYRDMAQDPAPQPLESAARAEVAERVRMALDKLSPTQREVLELAYYQGLSQSEIAAALNTPLGTVKTRSRQGLLQLRQTLQDLVLVP
jgi:RNA polymerase sigma-70 factor (ECF subfamily)